MSGLIKNFCADARAGDQTGFTLIELMVSTFLFAFVVSSVMGVYLYTLKLNRRTNVIRTATENARFISEFLSKEIRNGQLDYFGTTPAPCSTTLQSGAVTWLAVVNVDGEHECFYFQNNNLYESKYSNGTLFSAVQLNDPNTTINYMNFWVSPLVNPYSSGATDEPQVTFSFQVTSAPDPQDSYSVPIETTISIPKYDFPG